jgi:hypothetical protein
VIARWMLALVVVLAFACTPKRSGVGPNPTSTVVTAAAAFLATLDESRRAKVTYAFADDEQRARWSNFPVEVVPRGGTSVGELSDAQRAAAMTLLRSFRRIAWFVKWGRPTSSR